MEERRYLYEITIDHDKRPSVICYSINVLNIIINGIYDEYYDMQDLKVCVRRVRIPEDDN